MFSKKEWHYIENLKSLSYDEHGRGWKATNNINGFLIHLPLWAKDNPLEKTCLSYQVDSKGQLFLLSIIHVRQIKTTTDARHVRLEIWSVPKWRWGRIGLRSISPSDGAHVLPKMPGQPPPAPTKTSV